ncbi:uncharacterized protein LOC132752271 [Ruditapes philippinarum]|uniref:uncharacterized protein LOC132752271 n=1 Tax=Ruditapes philippinarum TaxID=129788 RepID=UPI00295B3AF1|nr:uncharacterized protein LOC132752271 [Ruditapes philippinarum]
MQREKMGIYFGVFVLLGCFTNISGLTCWDSKWFNESSTLKNGSSYEFPSVKVLDKICVDGSAVIAARCKDEKGEPFNITKNDTINHYYAVCNQINGLICHPYMNVRNATCPDFAIQYGCRGPPTAHTGGTGAPNGCVNVTTNYTTTVYDGNGITSARKHHCKNNAQGSKSVGLLLAFSTLVLKLVLQAFSIDYK